MAHSIDWDRPDVIKIAAEFPPKLAPLFRPKRYKILYGGRAASKSWSIARALLLIGHDRRMRILCAREYQSSINESVHRLLCDQIAELGLWDFYDIERNAIRGKNGTEFHFAGIKTNPTAVKSYEGINVVWIEEADNVSKFSWDTLLYTIRKTNSEIWVSFNPSYELSETYQRFVVHPPNNSVVIPISYLDNPWLSKDILDEIAELKARNMAEYRHIFLGECRQYTDGAVYLNELAQAEDEGRICRVVYDPALPVNAVFDLGYADSTACWIVQRCGFEYHAIDYVEDSRKPLDHYLRWLAERGYGIDQVWLPHDARARSFGTGRTTEELFRSKGYKTNIVANISIADGIQASRMMFAATYFDRERCANGLQALRHYRFEVSEKEGGGFKDTPVHDRWSHGADGWRYCCVALKPPAERSHRKYNTDYRRSAGNSTSWMAL